MGSYAHEMVRRSVEATINGDQELANQVIAEDDEVDRMERRILDQAVLTVMQEQPVAKDLLLLISTIGVVSEIEKVADHAVKLCRRSRSLQRTFPAEMKLALQEMGESARREFSSALRLYSAFTAELAEEVIHGDDAVDERYQEARSDLMQLIRQHPESTEYLVQSIEAFHALEHVADHAVAIAVRLKMVYSSGELKSSFES
jgi:phosphate transport system protein